MAQDFSDNQQIESIRQLYKKEQFQKALNSANNYILTLDTLQDSNNFEAILSLKGNILRHLGKPLLAISLHKKAKDLRATIYGASALEVSRSLVNIGNCYLDIEAFDLALDPLLKAKIIKEQQVLSETSLINVYNSLAFCYEQLQETAEAKNYIHRAIQVATEAYGPQDTQLIFPLNTLANFLISEKQPDSAIVHLKRAITIQQKTIGLNHSNTVLLYTNLARGLGESGRYTAAIDWLQEGLHISQQVEGGNPTIQANCLLNLGNYYLDKGLNQLGLEYLQRASSTYTDVANWAAAMNSIGLAYRYMGKTDKAIDELSIVISTVTDTMLDHKLSPVMADIYLNLGSCYLDKKEYEVAQYFLEKGATLFKQKALPFTVYNKLGQCFLGLQQYEAATQQFQLALTNTTGFRQFGSLYFLGMVRAAQNLPNQALSFYEAALQSLGGKNNQAATPFPFETIQIYDKLASWWIREARNSQTTNTWEQALLYAQKGIEILEILKGTIKEPHAEIDLQNTFYQIYNHAIESTLALQQPAKAFSLAERYKSNVLKKIATATANKHQFNLPPALLSEEKKLKEALTFYKKKRFSLERQILSDAEQQQLVHIKDTIGALLDQQVQWQQKITKLYPNYYQLMEKEPIINLSTIQQALNADQTLIEFQWSDHQLLTFLFTQDTFLVFQLPNSEELKTAISAFNFLSQKQPDLSGETQMVDTKNFINLASYLYSQLILPIQPYIKEELRIIPDSWLYFLPFECLIKEKGKEYYHFRSHQYLVQEVAISYDFAATLAIQKEKNTTDFKENLLIIAPSFAQNSRQLKELVYSPDEVTKVSDIVDATIWKGEQAKEKKFIEVAHQYQLLHIASHGIMDNQNPDYSFIAFTEQADSIENEVLYVSEIYNMHLNADLIVLSACQTAGGKLYRGEGLLSIAHAFMYAGAKSIIASLWNVDDEQTPDLMEKFYTALCQGHSKAKAIQKAKVAYLKDADHFKAHPYYWSGFMVIGNTNPLTITASPTYFSFKILAILVAVLLLLSFLYKLYRK